MAFLNEQFLNFKEMNTKYLRDTVCLLLQTPNKKFGLQNVDKLGFWLPYREVEDDEMLLSCANKLLQEIGISGEISDIVHTCSFKYHINIPPAQRTIFRVNVLEPLNETSGIVFLSLSQLQRMTYFDLRSSEPLDILKAHSQTLKTNYLEVSVEQPVFSDVTRIRNVPVSTWQHFLDFARFNDEAQQLIFLDFVNHVYPCEVMNIHVFRSYLMSFQWWTEERLKETLRPLFRMFDSNGNGYLTYREILLGLIAMNSTTPHGGVCAEIRCLYIFRYYGGNCGNELEYSQFKSLVHDLHAVKELSIENSSLEETTKQYAKIFQLQEYEKLSLSTFLHNVGKLKFRGTSSLLRTPEAVLCSIFRKWGMPPEGETWIDPGNPVNETTLVSAKYELATHSVKVKRSGALVDVNALWDMEGTSCLSDSVQLPCDFQLQRTSSIDSFDHHSRANAVLRGLLYFEYRRETGRIHKKAFHWGITNMATMARTIISLCRTVYDILYDEDRLLNVTSPAYVLGDIHGNFYDLVCFEKTLWRMGPLLTPASFVFLGDYVDRGAHGLEVISYLFSHKILAPDKFFLLRGNHEERSIQKMFTFHTECLNKFGYKLGGEVFEAINQCFDVMPLAAVIDNMVFCVHGGIFPPWMGDGLLNAIYDIPKPLKDPEHESELAWNIMWNDPLSSDGSGRTTGLVQENEGFQQNTGRQTGYMFTSEALERFLTTNGLTHIIRAHEVQLSGFKVQLNGKLLTVFSSSKYCGGTNEAACVLVDRLKLRTIRLDTS